MVKFYGYLTLNLQSKKEEKDWRVSNPIIHVDRIESMKGKIKERSQEGFNMLVFLALRS